MADAPRQTIHETYREQAARRACHRSGVPPPSRPCMSSPKPTLLRSAKPMSRWRVVRCHRATPPLPRHCGQHQGARAGEGYRWVATAAKPSTEGSQAIPEGEGGRRYPCKVASLLPLTSARYPAASFLGRPRPLFPLTPAFTRCTGTGAGFMEPGCPRGLDSEAGISLAPAATSLRKSTSADLAWVEGVCQRRRLINLGSEWLHRYFGVL